MADSDKPPPRPSKPLPEWLHFNSHDLKILFRCSAAAWIAALFMFIHPVLRTIGQATFFACLVLFINPPSGTVFIFLLATLTLLIGIGLAWGWGVITMKAALAARPQEETTARLQELQAEISRQVNATGSDPALVQQKLIYDGFMLDARVTAVYFAMICVFIYLLARLRGANPKFTLIQIFGTIIADLFLTIGPLLPSFQGTFPRVLIEPAAIGAGLGLVCALLFFPQSTSHTVLAAMQSLVELAQQPLEFTRARFAAAETETEHGEGDLALKDLLAARTRLITVSRTMEPAMGFLPVDFSRGRWGADDVKSLRMPVRKVLLTSLGLLDFHILRVSGRERLDALRAISGTATPGLTEGVGVGDAHGDKEIKEEKSKKEERSTRTAGQREVMESLEFIEAMTTPEAESLRSGTVQVLRECSGEILQACEAVAAISAECIHGVNSRRWLGSRAPDPVEQAQTALETLREARTAFAAQTTEKLIEQHGDVFDEAGKLRRLDTLGGSSVRGVMIGLAFEEHVISLADALEQLLVQILALLSARPSPRMWFPTSIHYAVRWVLRRNAPTPVAGPAASDTDPDDTAATQSDEAQDLFSRISRGYRGRRRNALGRILLGIYHWFISAEGLFALRMVVVSIALAIPAVIPASSGFYYREKGLWALIMAQTTLLVYMADFTFSLISRTIGTVLGGLIGLAAWYIGSGGGPGNSYGLAAITAPVVIVFMWGRLFLSMAMLQATIMSAATYFLIVGYSIGDSLIPQYGNPGIGYHVFWRRLVLVFVGFAAAIIVQIFPRPPSAARHICTSLSNTLRRLTDHYALLLSCWARSADAGTLAEQLSIEVAERLTSLDGPIALLRLEFSSSRFDAASLRQVQLLCQALNENLGRLLFLSATMPAALQGRLARSMGVLEQRAVGDVMAVLGVVAQTLKTGDALPEVLPTPLTKRCYEHWLAAQGGMEVLGTELIRDKGYRRFCVGVMAYLKVLVTVDELVMVMKEVLGERHLVQRQFEV